MTMICRLRFTTAIKGPASARQGSAPLHRRQRAQRHGGQPDILGLDDSHSDMDRLLTYGFCTMAPGGTCAEKYNLCRSLGSYLMMRFSTIKPAILRRPKFSTAKY